MFISFNSNVHSGVIFYRLMVITKDVKISHICAPTPEGRTEGEGVAVGGGGGGD